MSVVRSSFKTSNLILQSHIFFRSGHFSHFYFYPLCYNVFIERSAMAVIKFFTRFEMRCLFRGGCAYLKVSQGYLFSPGIIIFRNKLTELN